MKKQQSVVFCEKCFIKNFTKFTGKCLSQSVFFNKVVGMMSHASFRSLTLLKIRLCHRCFPNNFAKVLVTLLIQNTSRRLLLKMELEITEICYFELLSDKTSFLIFS